MLVPQGIQSVNAPIAYFSVKTKGNIYRPGGNKILARANYYFLNFWKSFESCFWQF